MNDDTQVGIAPDAPTLCALAWGDEAPTLDYPVPWHDARRRAAQIGLGAALLALGIVAVGVVAFWHPSLPVSSTAPAPQGVDRGATAPSTTASAPAPTVTIVPPTATVTASALTPPTVTETASAPPPYRPPPTSAQDQVFLTDFVSDANVTITDPAQVVGRAHSVCARLRAPDHPSRVQVANEQQAQYYKNSWDTCDALVVDAQTVYCPDTK